jgi:phage protein D
MDANRQAINSARPTFVVAGQDTPALSASLLRLVISDHVEGLASCEAEFGNWGQPAGGSSGIGYLWFDRRTLDFGAEIEVRLGTATLFNGRMTALQAQFPALAPGSVVVRAEDRLQDLRMTRRTRHFDNLSDADLVRRIAQDHGLQADIDLPGAAQTLIVQANESDLALLRRRALAADADVRLSGTTLAVRRCGSRINDRLSLTHGARLHHLQVAADLAHQRTAITCSGWDVSSKQQVSAQATASAVASEASGGDSGPAVLQRALGERKDSFAHAHPGNDSSARELAEAQMRLLARRFLRGRGECDPEPGLLPGHQVELLGLGPLFSGAYGVTEVTHRFDAAQGLRTAFAVERAWIGRP